MAHDVFISYSVKDREVADSVCASLEAENIKCWIAPRNILPGIDWGESIIQAITHCRIVILIFSSNANNSAQIKREVERAVSKEIPIVPFRIEEVSPSGSLEYYLGTPHWLDAHTPPLERHLKYLAESVKSLLLMLPEKKTHDSIAEVSGRTTAPDVFRPDKDRTTPAATQSTTQSTAAAQTTDAAGAQSPLAASTANRESERWHRRPMFFFVFLLSIIGVLIFAWYKSYDERAELNTTYKSYGERAELHTALTSITSDTILEHIRVLASDEFEGRAPGTRGEALTVNYLIKQFRGMGLKPGNPDGTYVQKVPLVGFTAQPRASFNAGGKRIDLRFPDDYVAISRHSVPDIKVENSDVVFVGYGVVAPEYGWDDYKGVDVRGKTVVMLINDPPIAKAYNPSKLDERMFKGKAMTYYGRWTYKYEIASEKGAAACIIVHETDPAGYPYDVVSGSWSRENFDIQTPDKNMSRVPVEAWLTLERTRELFAAGGKNFDVLKRAALARDFKPVALDAKANFEIKNTLREINSNNVVAKLEGADAKLKDEYVVYTAHWDHLGRDPKLAGDQIFNGALDNASGTASLLEIARAYTKLAAPPRRSILFLAVTAEEKGLLGAKYYAANPLYPLERTLANINMDGANQWGRTSDIVIVGDGNTTLDDLLRAAATTQNRRVKPDPEPEKGFFYRSDHFEFAKVGVPALYPDTGTEFVGKSPEYSEHKRDEYIERDYHKVSDEIKPDWDLSGAVEDAQLLIMVGYAVAQGDKFPEWKPGTEFKAKRDETLSRVQTPQ